MRHKKNTQRNQNPFSHASTFMDVSIILAFFPGLFLLAFSWMSPRIYLRFSKKILEVERIDRNDIGFSVGPISTVLDGEGEPEPEPVASQCKPPHGAGRCSSFFVSGSLCGNGACRKPYTLARE